eukprot:TRINITY_DN15003_c0_g1_i1.p1 TRINITY_DN15003_c0_g1~~TRINITY_DN15003_c0_g1_i1.p1  ORF type:complete len:191 (+),score=40.13 TRINITY_DN15003_c0_g1_i1:35-574(+)
MAGMDPPTPEEIGQAGWTILHTTAAAYPANPSKEQQKRMWEFINSWSHVYPCTHCAAHMRLEMKGGLMPDVSGKEGLSVWACKMHNKVNEVLGKDIFDCTFDSILKRWHPTYPNIRGTDQPGGFANLPPYGSKAAAFHSTPKDTHASSPQAAVEDPDMKALMDMTCTAFCPKNEKNGFN